MKKILIGALGAAVLATVTGGAVLALGLPSFAADEPHADAVTSMIAFVRERSIARAAADVRVPADISSPDRARRGAGNYEAMCSGCHLSPGVADSEIRKGLYPTPPNLASAGQEGGDSTADARRFWIVKHGIKGSGMPAWSKGGMDDAAIWDLVAFLRVLPGMSPDDYRSRVEASDGHAHAGMDGAEHGQGNHHQGDQSKHRDHPHAAGGDHQGHHHGH